MHVVVLNTVRINSRVSMGILDSTVLSFSRTSNRDGTNQIRCIVIEYCTRSGWSQVVKCYCNRSSVLVQHTKV